MHKFCPLCVFLPCRCGILLLWHSVSISRTGKSRASIDTHDIFPQRASGVCTSCVICMQLLLPSHLSVHFFFFFLSVPFQTMYANRVWCVPCVYIMYSRLLLDVTTQVFQGHVFLSARREKVKDSSSHPMALPSTTRSW